MRPIKLRDLSLSQLIDMQDERFCDAVLGEHPDEHDSQYLNHLSRHVVWAMQREKGAAFLGVLSPLYEEMPLFRPWEGERIDAFSAAFVVPTLDEELIRLVEDYREHVAELDANRLCDIFERVEELGGARCCIGWPATPSPPRKRTTSRTTIWASPGSF